MQKILCFGELLVYWIPRGHQTAGDLQVPLYAQFPGGAPANVAVGCQRLGVNSALIGQVGHDAMGRYLKDCMEKYHVDTQYLLRSDYSTLMAFIHLDMKGSRSFSFNRDNTADLNYPASELSDEMFNDVGIFHFSSNSLTEQSINDCTLHAMTIAREQQTLISFSVNLRLMIWPDLKQVKSRVIHALKLSDIAKFRAEEVDYLRGSQSESDFLSELFAAGLKVVLITDGDQAIRLYTRDHHQSFMTPQVTVVDNTVAGESFISGLLASLIEQCVHNPSQLDNACAKITPLIDAVNMAMCCGAYAITHEGAWNAMPTRTDIDELMATIETL